LPCVASGLPTLNKDQVAERGARLTGVVPLCVLWMLTAGLSGCARTPSNPDDVPGPPDSFLGTWSGRINSDAIGAGTATLVIDFQFGSGRSTLLGGTWKVSFPDPTFNVDGTLSGGFDPSGAILGLFFTPAAVPCPAETGAVAQKAMAASLTVAGKRMRGNYIAAGCPGGTLDLDKS